MQVFQLIHTLSYGDAISGEALAIKRCLSDLGHQGTIFSINTHPFYKNECENYKSFPSDFNGIVILHYSLGSVLNQLFANLKNAKRAIIFHNLTPEKYFAGINPRVAKDIAKGWEELPVLCGQSDWVISDSTYNRTELKQHNIDSVVLPLPFDPARWKEQANSGLVDLIRSDPSIHVLHVGRLAPNKCLEDILKTFYFLHHHSVARKARLWLVGIDIDTELYSFSLKRLADELHISETVNFTGPLTDAEIRALYENCSVYLGMSEHEGFCVPLIEAMHFELPVLAYDSTAVKDTVATGGILFREKKYPELAQLITKIAEPGDFRSRLIKQGRARVAELSFDSFKSNFTRILNLS